MWTRHGEKYDVFLSYAHSDVEHNPVRLRFLDTLKASIERLSRRPLVFLDSEELKRGETWNSKIRMAIQSCQVFVCLLSESYLKSSYCKREFLWWSQKELRSGRICKMTLPIYYVEFPDSFDNMGTMSRLASSVLALQMDLRPWFCVGERAFCEEEIRERLNEAVSSVGRALDVGSAVEGCFCSVRGYNPAFVGRLAELREIWEWCNSGSIPVLHAAGGVGKTELAIAFAHGFADEYPQGRFMIHAENATSWDSCLRDLTCGVEHDVNKPEMSAGQFLGLGPDDEKLPPEEFSRLVWSVLKERATRGRLLILVDNLNDMSLVGVKGLHDLDARGIPSNIHIIVTTRNTPSRGRYKVAVPFAVQNLDEDSSMELLRNYSPASAFNQDKPDECTEEFQAALQIVSLLSGHAWSLEIIGSYVGENWRRGMTYARYLDDLRRDQHVEGTTRTGSWMSDQELLGPTLAALGREEYGALKLELLKVAAVFAPDSIPVRILAVSFGELVRLSVGQKHASPSFDECADALRRYHLLSFGCDEEEPVGKARFGRMHRLTRAALLRKFSGDLPRLAEMAFAQAEQCADDDDEDLFACREMCLSFCDFITDAIVRAWRIPAVHFALTLDFSNAIMLHFIANRGLQLMEAIASLPDSCDLLNRCMTNARFRMAVEMGQFCLGLGRMREAQSWLDTALSRGKVLCRKSGDADDGMENALTCSSLIMLLIACVEACDLMEDQTLLSVNEKRFAQCQMMLQRSLSCLGGDTDAQQELKTFEPYIHFNRGKLARIAGRNAQACRDLKKVLCALPPDDCLDDADLALKSQVYVEMAVAKLNGCQPKSAYAHAQKAIGLLERCDVDGPERVLRAQAISVAAHALKAQGLYGESKTLFEDVEVRCRRMVEAGAPKGLYVDVLRNLVLVSLETGDEDRAETASAELSRILLEMKNTKTGVPRQCADGLVERGDYLLKQGRCQESIRWYREGLEIYERFRHLDKAAYVEALMKLSKATQACGNLGAAQDWMNRAAACVAGGREGSDRSLRLRVLYRHAKLLHDVGSVRESAGRYDRLYALAARYRAKDAILGLAYMVDATLGQLDLLGAEESVRCEQLERRIVKLKRLQVKRDLAKYGVGYLISLNNHAVTLGKLGRMKSSCAAFAEGIEACGKMACGGVPGFEGAFGTLLDNVDALSANRHGYEGLAAPLERAATVLKSKLPSCREIWRMSQWCLAKLFSSAGRLDEAQAVVEDLGRIGLKQRGMASGATS